MTVEHANLQRTLDKPTRDAKGRRTRSGHYRGETWFLLSVDWQYCHVATHAKA